MQRYRVNYRLLTSLVVGGIIAAAAATGLWWFQINRNASQLLARADLAEKDGDKIAAFKSLFQYNRLRQNETDARIRLANVAADILEEGKASASDQRDAYGVLMDSVVRTDDKGVRRRLLDLQAKYQQFDVVLQNANELINDGETDPELKVLKARSLFFTQKSAEAVAYANKLIGYDSKADKFDESLAEAPDQPVVYAMLASYLQGNRQPELARRVIDRLVEANPKSREAYLFRYQVLKGLQDNEEATKSLAEAYKLDPEDAGVLNAKGAEELIAFQEKMLQATLAKSESEKEAAQKHLDEAAKYFGIALEKYPDRVGFYERVAQIDNFRQKYDEALETIKKGLAQFDLRSQKAANDVPIGIGLENLKFEILFSQQKLDLVDAEIKELQKLNNPAIEPLISFQTARIDAIRENWASAARKLESVKARLINFPELQGLASAIEGFCRQQLGQYDLALEAYEWALQKNKDLPQAQAGAQEMRRLLGQSAGAEVNTAELDSEVRKVLELPPSQQDWDGMYKRIDDFIDQQAAGRGYSKEWVDSRKQLLRAQTYVLRGENALDDASKLALYGEARTAVRKAYELQPDDTVVKLAAPRLLMTEPGSGPATALKLLDRIVAKGGDSPDFRALRIEILGAIGGEDVASKINAATENLGDWTPGQQAKIWMAAGAQFERIGQLADAVRCIKKGIELSPKSLPTRLALFNLTLKQGDDDAMRDAQKLILDFVKDPTVPDYVLTEVKRLLVLYANGKATDEEMHEASRKLDAAIKARPTFADLYITRGQLALVVDKNVDEALKNFDDALSRGQANYNAVGLQVRLLADRRRFKEARERMDRMPPAVWSSVLDRVAATVLEAVGENDKAVHEAESVAKVKPDDASTQAWLGEVAERAKSYDVAEKAYQKAVDLNPSDPEAWMKLISLYLQLRRGVDFERAMRGAHIALDDEYLPILMAKYYERMGRWQEAEDIYLSAYANNPNQVFVARRLAEFYLTWYAQNDANLGKAAVQVNRILHAVNDGKIDKNEPDAAWARRQAARLFSLGGDYQDSLKAEKLLLASADKDGNLSMEDQAQLIQLLDRRGDPAARHREVDMLRSLQKAAGLDAEHELMLARALLSIDKEKEARKSLEDAIGRNPQDVALRAGYITMLLELKALDDADRWLMRMNEVTGADQQIKDLRLRLAAARDNKTELRTQLEALTPNLRVLNAEQLQTVRAVALLANSLGDYEYALKLMKEYARRSAGSEFELAQLVALHGDIDEALTMLKQLFDKDTEKVVAMAVEMLRSRRSEAPEKLDEELGRLIRAARRDDPESARYMVLEAELLEVQGKIEESIAAYKTVLAGDDIPKLIRATASNNLAFLLSLKNESAPEALEAANAAIELVGPISDILDTRGLAYLASGQTEKAVDDFKLAVTSGPTASKFFHLAQALLAAGDERGAVAAWDKAELHGLSPEKVSTLEVGEYNELEKKIESLKQAG